MKLRTKFGIVLLVMTLVLGSATYGGLELYKQEMLAENEQSVNESAHLAANQIDDTLSERRDYVGYVASRPDAGDFDQSDELIHGVVDNSRFFAAQVIAANGTVVAFDGQIDAEVRRETIGSNVADEAYFARATTQSSYVSDPEAVNSTNRYIVVISAPILDDDGLRGVFAASIYVSEETFLNPVGPLDSRSQRVTVTDGPMVLYDSDDRFSQVTTGTATVESVGWTVRVQRDRSQLNQRLRSLAVAQGVGLLLVLFTVVGFWMWEYRMNLQQTEQLLDAFTSLREGKYGRRIDLDAGEEWVQISDGFNELAQGLASQERAVREREQRLEVLNRVLRHNLRNDMNVVLGYAELIGERTQQAALEDAAQTIQTTGTRLVDLSRKARWVDDALSSTDTDYQRIDVAATTRDIVERVTDEYPDVTLDVTTPESASVDATPALRTAIGNVVENACEHNDASDPRVTVTVTADPANPADSTGGAVRVSVVDNGPGIPTDERDAVLTGEETPLEHGSGIGLWVTRWLVDYVGGVMEFEENDPRGSVVTLVFERSSEGDE